MGPPAPANISSTMNFLLIRKFMAYLTSLIAKGLKYSLSAALRVYGALFGMGLNKIDQEPEGTE